MYTWGLLVHARVIQKKCCNVKRQWKYYSTYFAADCHINRNVCTFLFLNIRDRRYIHAIRMNEKLFTIIIFLRSCIYALVENWWTLILFFISISKYLIKTTYMLHQLWHHSIPFSCFRILSSISTIRHHVYHIIKTHVLGYPFKYVNTKAVESGIPSKIFPVVHHYVRYLLDMKHMHMQNKKLHI